MCVVMYSCYDFFVPEAYVKERIYAFSFAKKKSNKER